MQQIMATSVSIVGHDQIRWVPAKTSISFPCRNCPTVATLVGASWGGQGRTGEGEDRTILELD